MKNAGYLLLMTVPVVYLRQSNSLQIGIDERRNQATGFQLLPLCQNALKPVCNPLEKETLRRQHLSHVANLVS